MALSRLPVDVTLVDRRNFHLFQPLAYQVATGALSPAEICYPLRRIFRRRRNVRIMLAEVSGFDLDNRRLQLEPVIAGERPRAARLRLAGRLRRLGVQLLRPRRVARLGRRAEVARRAP